MTKAIEQPDTVAPVRVKENTAVEGSSGRGSLVGRPLGGERCF